MKQYVVEVQTAEQNLAPGRAQELLSALANYHAAVDTAVGQHVQITITVPATCLRQAVQTALAVIEQCGAEAATAITVVPEQDHAAHHAWVDLPELVGVTEAGAILGITRQAVLGLIDRGQLPGRHVTPKIIATSAATVHARKTRMDQTSPTTGEGD